MIQLTMTQTMGGYYHIIFVIYTGKQNAWMKEHRIYRFECAWKCSGKYNARLIHLDISATKGGRWRWYQPLQFVWDALKITWIHGIMIPKNITFVLVLNRIVFRIDEWSIRTKTPVPKQWKKVRHMRKKDGSHARDFIQRQWLNNNLWRPLNVFIFWS